MRAHLFHRQRGKPRQQTQILTNVRRYILCRPQRCTGMWPPPIWGRPEDRSALLSRIAALQRMRVDWPVEQPTLAGPLDYVFCLLNGLLGQLERQPNGAAMRAIGVGPC